MAKSLDLKGIIPATVTPMTEDAEIDEKQLRGYIEWLCGYKGIKGLAVNMDTGEGPHLTDAERKRIVEIYKEMCGDDLPILAGVCGRSTAEAMAQAAMYREAGADALVVFPPPVFAGGALGPKIPVEYHRAIYKASGLPMVLFQLQAALAGAIFSDETLTALCRLDGVIALKEASFDALTFISTANIMRKFKDKITLLTGNDNFIYESFVLGARGALIGFGTLAVQEQIEMHRASMNRNYELGLMQWEKVKPLCDIVFGMPVRDYRARTKVALKHLGVISSTTMRPPLMDVSPEEQEKIMDALDLLKPAPPTKG
jgi:4-hydroxy-tetrahydrodipicolinate synthase